jgi:hypothetical protein
MTAAECPEDLLVGERRGTLTAGQRRDLTEHRVGCALCRLDTAIGRAIDPLLEVDADDAALAARLVDRVLAPRAIPARAADATAARRGRRAPVGGPPPPARRLLLRPRHARRRSLAVAAVLLLTAGVSAAAALWRVSPWRAPSASQSDGAPPPSGRRAAPRSTLELPGSAPAAPPVAPAPEPPAVVTMAGPEAAGRPQLPSSSARRLPASSAAAAPTAAVSAADLFAAANRARSRRQPDEAVRLYHKLQRTMPASAEAALSYVSLGNLQLGRGAADDALAAFNAYLAGGDALLDEEAMVGRARALAQLGRDADERTAWQALLARYPRSSYRWRAEQRIAELP